MDGWGLAVGSKGSKAMQARVSKARKPEWADLDVG